MRMNTTIDVKRIKELVFRTTNESRKQFIIDSGNTHDEVFLGQNCVKIIRRHHVRSHREPGGEKYLTESETKIFYLGYGQP